MCYFSPRKQAWSNWNLVPQSCVMNASLSFILSSFSKWGQLCFCQHSWFWNKFQLLQACLRGKSGTFWKWHCLRIIALESKRLIHTLWTWCQITWKRIFYPIQQKSMVFNQECRWNNGSKSLHSFGPPCICAHSFCAPSIWGSWIYPWNRYPGIPRNIYM